MLSYTIAHTFDFVLENVPLPARLLEVGCGRGELAKALQDSGFDVVAIDADAEAIAATSGLGVQAIQCDFLDCFDQLPNADQGFDCIFFGRSLHHIHPLEKAVESCARLLAADGVIVVEDFALESITEREVNWLFGLQDVLLATGVLSRRAGFGGVDANVLPIDLWRSHHLGHHRLSTAEQMKSALVSRFEITSENHAVFMYRYIADNLVQDSNRNEIAASVAAWEARFQAEADKPPVGVRLVVSRR